MLIGERLNESGEYETITISESEGSLTAYSDVLGLDLFARDGALRMYDTASQTWLRNFREEIAARRIAEDRAQTAEDRAQTAEDRAQTAEDRAALLESILREHGIAPPNGG